MESKPTQLTLTILPHAEMASRHPTAWGQVQTSQHRRQGSLFELLSESENLIYNGQSKDINIEMRQQTVFHCLMIIKCIMFLYTAGE